MLNLVEGGCSASIGAYASVSDRQLHFSVAVPSLNGKEKVAVSVRADIGDDDLADRACEHGFKQGAKAMIEEIRSRNAPTI